MEANFATALSHKSCARSRFRQSKKHRKHTALGQCSPCAAGNHANECARLTPSDPIIRACESPTCKYSIHRACLEDLRGTFDVSTDLANTVVCGKRCYNASSKQARVTAETAAVAKKRVAWHNDGPTPDVSSLACLVDWMTTGENYSSFRGGEEQTGETKMALASEVVRAIARCGIATSRSQDVMTKISGLEQAYKRAADWLGATGQGVEDAQTLRSTILMRCPQYYELHHVMEDRPSTRPLLLNTDVEGNWSDSDASTSDENAGVSTNPAPTARSKRPSSVPQTIVRGKTTKKSRTDVHPQSAFAELKSAQLAQENEFEDKKLGVQERQVAVKEKELAILQERATNDAREVNARIKEAEARADHCRVQTQVLERKKMLEEGIAQSEIDLVLPLGKTSVFEDSSSRGNPDGDDASPRTVLYWPAIALRLGSCN